MSAALKRATRVMLTLSLCGALACETANSSGDAMATPEDSQTTSDTGVGAPESPFTPLDASSGGAEAPPPEPVTGCDWAAGQWLFTDCLTPDGISLQFVLSGCTLQLVSESPGLSGAYGTVYDSGLTLFAPSAALTCNGFFDGSWLTGACSSATTSPCWFIASKQ
jgi:hypothetical protein